MPKGYSGSGQITRPCVTQVRAQLVADSASHTNKTNKQTKTSVEMLFLMNDTKTTQLILSLHGGSTLITCILLQSFTLV